MPPNTDPITTSVWVRKPRARRGQPTLSREQIVSAALELLDADGLDGLTMRRLGARLGAGATSVYWYVANKDELLELAIDEVMSEVEIPDPEKFGWRAAAGEYARRMRAMILRHSWISALLGVHPAIGPNALRVSDQAIGVLSAAGFSGPQLAYASYLLMSHAIGSATTESAMRTATASAGKNANELVSEMEPYLQSVASQYPNYVAWWSEARAIDWEKSQDEGFAFGLERLLDGLESWLAG